ncbi:hypothetical protein MYCTH_2307166 [Thermothelomyces thermophilus ATCC 42464]|uniref:Leucine-rich repeat-containing protein 40 n=1 Tax=Thermothelomyces thermophilus (strain ATCC 42464 / BCRC 31852 / DSM 1799) TaxID=573729 RepID=G2QFB8_THET4|nr:uncharacterized protein MYCTH_2307166 [Thermothelomyces thermophilus ATCC 42464]AEO59147.1 hypothetical protein MYCTH_2307166 [Thermothelomyces thermophilus ATCC 42464]
MEETRPNRPSGIPRPSKIPVQTSKLPLPRTNSIRTSPSRESLNSANGTGHLRNPKLRTTPSRDQLAPAPTATAAPTNRSQPSTAPLRAVSSPHSRAGVNQVPAGNARDLRPGPNTTGQERGGTYAVGHAVRSSSATTGSLRRQSSQQWISAGTMPEEEPGLGASSTIIAEEDANGGTSPESPSKLRPSLVERTVETLSRLPSSPSVKGRGAASFYDAAATRPTSPIESQGSRSESNPQSDGSGGQPRSASRPGSSSGLDESISGFRSQLATSDNPLSPVQGIPLRSRRSVQSLQMSSAKTTSVRQGRTSLYGMGPPNATVAPRARTPSPGKTGPEIPAPKSASKTLAPRPLNKRHSVNGLVKKPAASAQAKPETTRKASLASRGSSATSGEGSSNLSTASVASGSTAITADSTEPGQSYKKTSAALREQIAKARAAKKAAAQQNAVGTAAGSEEPAFVPADASFDFGLSNDPFNQNRDDKSQAKVLRSRLETARTSGRLNIAAMGLKEIPAEVLNMYNLESIGQSGSAWAESVDLTRFVAADNELEMISDSVFPDVDPQELAEDEDSQGNIFAGLETLDLHGNILVNLPMGLRRLSFLTSLNLSLNRLSNSCLEVICQVTSLKDLKLGGNLLYGPLDPCFSKLVNLEILDLHGNNLSSLPAEFGNLSRLRILNLSENGFEELPFDVLAGLPLRELIARKNQLSGTLIKDAVDAMPTLQALDVSSNQLAHLCSWGRSVRMPALHQLCVSMNRLQALPDVSTWTSLVTLAADENSINAIPEGFTKLEQLRSVDFSSNDIRVVPPEVGRMENLSNLRLSGNPLREKKYSTISTEEMKSILAQRLEPEAVEHQDEPATNGQDEYFTADDSAINTAADNHVHEDDESRSDLEHFATPPTSAPASPARSRSQTATWPVKSGGVLDRSNTESSSLHPVICSKLAATHKVSEIQLHHNLFTGFPESLTFFAATLTALSLAHNQLVGETYLGGASGNESLDLPALKELNLTHNHITGLTPLTSHLRAPQLQKLDVSFNRLAALPQGTQLRDAFPNLTVLLASNNHLADLDPETIRGLKVVDASNNDIAHLNPRIGLLGGSGGLERLDVSGNRFRVPRWNVLERGTEATLRWLRGRVPVAEMGAWKGENGEDDDDVD